MNPQHPLRPAEYAEKGLVCGIIDETFPINSYLPPERELASRLGVTRPTLREALQRMARDGWIEIHQGKPTRVKDYWIEGNLNVLISLSKIDGYLPDTFIVHLLNIRACLCPEYTSLAIQNHPEKIVQFLQSAPQLSSDPEEFSLFDLNLHSKLTIFSQNPAFTLILNGFYELIKRQSTLYFSFIEPREYSLDFYQKLSNFAQSRDAKGAGELSEKVMDASIQFWQKYAMMKAE